MGITIHGAGCALMDYLYRGLSFESTAVQQHLQREPGDGGLIVGGLVFAEALERRAHASIDEVIRSIAEGHAPDRENVGGPAIVSLIHTAQLVPEARVRFFGAVGNDEAGRTLRSIVDMTPLDSSCLMTRDGATAATYVFSDPDFANGHGERLFVNVLGVASEIRPDDLGAEFPMADLVQLGGTALVPRLHDALPELLQAARENGALTVVNTVYDFRSQANRPEERWTLGDDSAYPLIDLLIADAEEARRLTGRDEPQGAIEWFLEHGTGAAVITNGPAPVWFAASGERFAASPPARLAVFASYAASPAVRRSGGDTTGCGDTFAGGLVAGLARQLEAGGRLHLDEAVRLAVASGAFCLTHLGGTFLESRPGEKRELVADVLTRYASSPGDTR